MLGRNTRWMFTALAVAMLSAGCVFVQPTMEGKKVRLLAAHEVDRCRSLGTMTSQVPDHVAAIPRDREEIEEDVLTNAKNGAAKQGGDTIVAVSKLEGGMQKFGVYRCLTP